MTTDIQEMRKAIFQVARGVRITPGDPRFFGAVFVRQALDLQHHAGLSGEDVMTLIAFHALRENERLSDLVFESALAYTPSFIVGKGEAGSTA